MDDYRIEVAEGNLLIQAPRESDLHRVLRASTVGLRWDAQARTWVTPTQQWHIVAGWCATNNVDYPLPPRLHRKERVDLTIKGHQIVVRTPSANSGVAAELSTSKWASMIDKGSHMDWTVHVRFAAQLAAVIARYDHDALAPLQGITPLWQAQARRNIELSTAEALPAGVAHPAIRGLKSDLMPQQEVSIHLLHTNGSLINSDEQGLGKTLQGLAAARVAGKEMHRLLIACPSSLAPNWIVEMDEHFEPGTFTPYLATGQTPDPIPADADVVIVGWPNLVFWLDALRDWSPDLALFDEAQYAKKIALNTKQSKNDEQEGSIRGAAFLDICSHVVSTGGLVCALTGTPVTNRPVEILPLLEATGAISYFGGRERYLNRYCAPKQTPRGTIYQGNSNTIELHQLLCASGHYLRRTKEFLVNKGLLKPKYVDGARFYSGEPEHPIIIKGDVAAMGRYYRARTDIINFLIEEVRKTNPRADGSMIRRKLASPRAKMFSELATLRKLAAEAKVPYIMALTDALIADGEKVVLAAHHREIVDMYADRYGNCKIQGGMTLKKIEEAKWRFNTQPIESCPVLVLSTEAGKTGHTLCKQYQYPEAGKTCARMIAAEQGWVPGDEAQTQDRIWRIGQPREVRIANVLVEDTTDEMIYGVRKKKQAVVNEVTDGVPTEREVAGMIFTSLFDQVAATSTI